MQEQLVPSEPLSGNGYDQAHGLPRSMEDSLQKMQGSPVARALFGEDFVTGYCAVKALELASFQSEISAWERFFAAAGVKPGWQQRQDGPSRHLHPLTCGQEAAP